MEKWYQNLKWRTIVDMHIPDWDESFMSKFDSREYARLMEVSGTELCEVSTGNCLGLCYFPTKVGHMHNGIKGVDITSNIFGELDKRKIPKMAYFNIWSRWAFDTHPGWRVTDQHGHTPLCNENGEEIFRLGFCCINNEEYRAYVKEQITQLVTDYEMEGLWIDMLGWFGKVCYCQSCREKFMRQTGQEIPKQENWDSPQWMAFQRFREQSMVELAIMIRKTALEIRPNLIVVFNSAAWDEDRPAAVTEEFLEKNEYLAGDFYGGPLMYSAICKALNNLTENRPVEFMTSRNVDLLDHTTIKSMGELRNSVYASLAHDAAFVFIDGINPDGTMNQKVYEKFGQLKKETEKFYEHWNPKSRMLSDVVFYFNLKSTFDPRRGESHYLRAERITREHIMVMAKTMIQGHIPYDVIFKKNLGEAIKTKQVIILSDIFILDEEEIRLFTQFVEQGGQLIVTGLTGMYDAVAGKRENFALAHIMGVDYEGEQKDDHCYFCPVHESLYEEYDETYPMLGGCPAVLVRNRGARVLSQLIIPWNHSKEIYRYGAAQSDPPKEKTDYPMVTVNAYGKGRVMYIASPFECDKKEAQRQVFRNHVRYMMSGATIFEMKAPSWLDAMLFEDGDGVYRMTFLASMEEYQEDCCALDVEVLIRLKGISHAYSVMDGRELPCERISEGLKVQIDCIHDFEMILLS